MVTRVPLLRTYRQVTFKFQTFDVRPYLFQDIIRRTRNAVVRSGGLLDGGVFAPPKHIKRWCVLRSPHVNKKSREHFWMVSHRRVYKWNSPANIDENVPKIICDNLPATVAARVQMSDPGLKVLAQVHETLRRTKEVQEVKEVQEGEEGKEREKVDGDD